MTMRQYWSWTMFFIMSNLIVSVVLTYTLGIALHTSIAIGVISALYTLGMACVGYAALTGTRPNHTVRN